MSEETNAAQEAKKRDAALLQSFRLFQRATQENPRDSRSLFGLATVLHRMGKLQSAESFYRKSLEIQPDNVECLTNLSILLDDEGRLEEACCCMERAFTKNSRDLGVLSNYGHLLCKQNDFTKAEQVLKRALRLCPTHVLSLHNYACLLWRKDRDIRKAEELFAAALRLDPSHEITRSALRDMKEEEEKLEDAADYQARHLLAEMEQEQSQDSRGLRCRCPKPRGVRVVEMSAKLLTVTFLVDPENKCFHASSSSLFPTHSQLRVNEHCYPILTVHGDLVCSVQPLPLHAVCARLEVSVRIRYGSRAKFSSWSDPLTFNRTGKEGGEDGQEEGSTAPAMAAALDDIASLGVRQLAQGYDPPAGSLSPSSELTRPRHGVDELLESSRESGFREAAAGRTILDSDRAPRLPGMLRTKTKFAGFQHPPLAMRSWLTSSFDDECSPLAPLEQKDVISPSGDDEICAGVAGGGRSEVGGGERDAAGGAIQLPQDMAESKAAGHSAAGGGVAMDARSDKGEDECVICMENVLSHVIVPCGHLAICEVCSLLLEQGVIDRCPVCNVKSTPPHTMKVYRP